ncbi:hypothetical protein HDZ31DRAFT_70519, partial [Schizophyllum fasciatum]
MPPTLPSLHRAAFTHPAIDNHAHPLLTAAHAHKLPLPGIVSEAAGPAADSVPSTLVSRRATKQLAGLLGLTPSASASSGAPSPSWADIARRRRELSYDELCALCFGSARIQSILIDDGLGGVAELAEGFRWHDRFMLGGGRCFVI